MTRGYPYRRIEDAYYARNAEIKASTQGRASTAIVCQTLDGFIVKLTVDGYPINKAYRGQESVVANVFAMPWPPSVLDLVEVVGTDPL